VQLACEIAEKLEGEDIGADVISMPCWELFELQDAEYRESLIPADVLVVSIEAGTTMGWHKYTGRDGLTVGIDTFGASAPDNVLFKHFGFTAEAIIPQIKAKLSI
jgi:transketolase